MVHCCYCCHTEDHCCKLNIVLFNFNIQNEKCYITFTETIRFTDCCKIRERRTFTNLADPSISQKYLFFWFYTIDCLSAYPSSFFRHIRST